MWQELRAELHPLGLEVITIALDTAGVDAAARFIDAAAPEHPSLIDQSHLTAELFGIVNVPSGVWIDEEGAIVRPPETAFPGKAMFAEMMKGLTLPEDVDPYVVKSVEVARRIRRPDPRAYAEALRDWAAKGGDSRFALAPEEVLERSRPRPPEEARAAAHFELGQHLHRTGFSDDAIPHFREAHRLAPRNWTYKRQAWSFLDPLQRPSEVYEGDWAGDVERLGPETYYPEPQL